MVGDSIRVIKAGIIAGIIGVVISLANLFIAMFLQREYPASAFFYISMALQLACIVIPGIIAGVLASRNVMSKTAALLPGALAAAIVNATGALFMLAMIAVSGALVTLIGQDFLWDFLLGRLFTWALTIVLAGLCSALAVFFTRELYWSIPSPDPARDPSDLQALYDTLWADARTLVLDMNRSIRVYLFVGLLIIACGLAILANGIGQWLHVSDMSVYPGYFIAMFEVAGGLIQLILGGYLLYWYDKLKKRYTRLMQIEKTLGA